MMALRILNTMVLWLWLYLKYWWTEVNFSPTRITSDRRYTWDNISWDKTNANVSFWTIIFEPPPGAIPCLFCHHYSLHVRYHIHSNSSAEREQNTNLLHNDSLTIWPQNHHQRTEQWCQFSEKFWKSENSAKNFRKFLNNVTRISFTFLGKYICKFA